MKAASQLLAFAALIMAAPPAIADTYTLATSWQAGSTVTQISSDGATLYLMSPSGVSHYDATGGLLGTWTPLHPSTIAGFDGVGNVLLAEYQQGQVSTTIRVYTPGGVPVASSEFADVIKAVDRSGFAYAPGLDFGIAKYSPDGSPIGDYGAEIGLEGIAWDETLIGIDLNDPDVTVGWFATSGSRLGTVTGTLCREGFESSCYVSYSATTDGHGGVFVAAGWHEPASNPDGFDAGASVDHYDSGGQRVGRFASFGKLASDTQGAVYVRLDSGVVEKWVPATTPARSISLGAVKARYAR